MHNPFIERVTTPSQTVGRRTGRVFGIYRSGRLFHHFILGQTGTGKSTLIRNMILQDIQHCEGFCLIDPHDDLAQSLRDYLTDHAIYWDIADPLCDMVTTHSPMWPKRIVPWSPLASLMLSSRNGWMHGAYEWNTVFAL